MMEWHAEETSDLIGLMYDEICYHEKMLGRIPFRPRVSLCLLHKMPCIFTCIRAHKNCYLCTLSSERCPVCNFRKLKWTSPLMEQLLNVSAVFAFPCRFAKNGCHFKAQGSAAYEHEARCKYGEKICPFATCLRTCTPDEFFSHLKKEHLVDYKNSTYTKGMLNFKVDKCISHNVSSGHKFCLMDCKGDLIMMLFRKEGKTFSWNFFPMYQYLENSKIRLIDGPRTFDCPLMFVLEKFKLENFLDPHKQTRRFHMTPEGTLDHFIIAFNRIAFF